MRTIDEDVRERFRKEAMDGKITCEQCMKICDETKIDKGSIASTLTEMDIKIIHCQIGCFR